MVHRAAWFREKKDAWPQTSPQLFQQKTDDMEQVFEVVSQEKDIDWETFGSFGKKDPDLRLLPSVPIENQRKSSHERRIAASDPNATAEKPDGKLRYYLPTIGSR